MSRVLKFQRHIRLPLMISLVLAGFLSFSCPAAGQLETREGRSRSTRRSVGFSPRSLDALSQRELRHSRLEPGEPLSDAEFLRRVYLDVVGTIPSIEQTVEFLASSHPRKRAKVIAELLETEQYARHWARFWTDVITFRTRGEDDHLKTHVLHEWLTQQLRDSTPWDQVARELITATGRNDESGPANFILAQMARAEDLGAETCRVFLGIRLQCAECHDDPEDTWTRQQFHEMAAFFGKLDEIRVEPEQPPRVAPGVKPPNPPFRILVVDTVWKEYVMPDMLNPLQGLPVLRPRALSGPALPAGVPDEQRRAFLALWVTGAQNLWFSRAYVNRVWTRLFGHGFSEDVDDMGPGRKLSHPDFCKRLAAAWQSSGYDTRWLMSTILNSETYQRKLVGPASAIPSALRGVAPQPLEAWQLVNSVATVFDMTADELTDSLRGKLLRTFETDPSTPPHQLSATISHALLVMNDSELDRLLQNRGAEIIQQAAASAQSPSDAVNSIFLRVLTRNARQEELDAFESYARKNERRDQAIEDLFWCLVNSTEFMTKL